MARTIKGSSPAVGMDRQTFLVGRFDGHEQIVIEVRWPGTAILALLEIVWWLGGAERIAVIGDDLLVRHTLFRVPVTTRAFRGRDIRHLAASGMREEGWLREPWPPFLSSNRIGGVKFSYRETLVYLGYDLDQAAAGDVVAWLAPRLPNE